MTDFFALCAVITAMLITAGCSPPDKEAVTADQAASASPAVVDLEPDLTPRRYSVVPYGYNYTDTYIDSFDVNGAGGGNLDVSSPTAPGGGSVCCMTLVSGLPTSYPFTVTWTRDRERWCEQTVYLTKPVPRDPRYFEVHFYQDGHIEVEATKEASEPRLRLDSVTYARRHETDNVNNDERFSRCRNARN